MFDGPRAWIGFTRIRPTKFREAVSWVRQGFQRVLPSHIACYELERRRCVAEIDVELPGLNAVFSIVPGRDSAVQTEPAEPSKALMPNLSLRQGAEAIQ